MTVYLGNNLVAGSIMPDYGDIIDALYPVGSVYIGTGVSCPLSAIKGTWTLQGSGIVTSVNSNVPCKGNGMTLGLTNGRHNMGLGAYGGDNASARLRSWTQIDLYGTPYDTTGTSSESSTTAYKTVGLAEDETKSGIVGTVSSTTLSVNIWERTA